MTDLSPAMISIAVLAVFALAWGGVVALIKRRDRLRGILMIVAAVVLLANVLIWTLPVR